MIQKDINFGMQFVFTLITPAYKDIEHKVYYITFMSEHFIAVSSLQFLSAYHICETINLRYPINFCYPSFNMINMRNNKLIEFQFFVSQFVFESINYQTSLFIIYLFITELIPFLKRLRFSFCVFVWF